MDKTDKTRSINSGHQHSHGKSKDSNWFLFKYSVTDFRLCMTEQLYQHAMTGTGNYRQCQYANRKK